MLAVLAFALAAPAFAELQNVQVGGELRIRYNYIGSNYDSTNGIRPLYPPAWIAGRPMGIAAAIYGWDKDSNASKFTEMRTRLNVKADFTDEVCAYVEFDSYDIWGEDFRSNYVTGADFRQNDANDDVSVYQAYIQAKNMWGTPLQLRVGRQELAFGSQWLVGTKDFGPNFVGQSFDALRLTYATDMFSVDAFAAKLAEAGLAEEDGDTDFYGVYASCTAVENWTFDAYYFLLRDAAAYSDSDQDWFSEAIQDWFGVDDYDPTNLNTVGLRANGTWNAFDFNAEAAYQFGDAGRIGSMFRNLVVGDEDAEFDNWGGTVEAGYTFDMAWTPRVFLGADYIGGEDNRDLSWFQWWWPFDKPQSSISFNRLFSNQMYSGFLDLNNDLSNVWIARGGATVHPLESVSVTGIVSHFEALDPFDAPYFWKFGNFIVPLFPNRSYAAEENSSDLGWQVDLITSYNYTEDLSFVVHYAHLFVGDGLTDGAYSAYNGLVSTQGTDNDDSDYIAFETRLRF